MTEVRSRPAISRLIGAQAWCVLALMAGLFCALGASRALGASLLGVEFGGKDTTKIPKAFEGPVRKGYVQPGPPKNGPAAFLTEAIDWDIEANSKIGAHLFYPTKIKTEQPFYDIPIAVNVPFEVPFEGGTVRVFFDVNIIWDEPEQKAKIGEYRLFPEEGGWELNKQGIYRMDGAAIAPENVVWEIDAKDSVKMVAPAESPFPLLLNGDLPTAKNNGSNTTDIDINSPLVTVAPRAPFRGQNNRSIFAPGRPLTMRSAQPGWYALWFTINPRVNRWPPNKLRGDDTLRAKILVHYIVARRERFNGGSYFYDQELNYLWGGADLKLDRPIDPNLVRVHSVEIPVVLRRDGWVLSRVESRRLENDHPDRTLADAKSEKYYGRTIEPTVATVQKGKADANATGVKATFQIDNFERKEGTDPWPSTPKSSITLTWDVTVPGEIPDGGVGEIAARGGIVERGLEKTIWTRGFADNSGIPDWLHSPVSPSNDRDKLHASWLTERLSPTDKADYLKYWAERLGDPGATKYFPANNNSLPPRSASEVKKYWIYASPTAPDDNKNYENERRQMLYKDMGPQPLYTLRMGVWEVDCYYRRKKDLEKSADAAPGAGAATIANEKDPYWEWFVPYCRTLTEKLTAAGAAFAQAAPRGETIKHLEDRARKLLEAVATQAALAQANAGSIVNVANATNQGGFTPGAREAGRVLGNSIGSAAEEAGRIWNWEHRNVVATMSEAMFTRMLEEARKLTAQAQEERRLAVEQMNEGLRYYDELDAELSRAYDRYGEKHPELLRWRTAQGIEKAMKRYAFAAATKDMHIFREAVEASGLGDIDPSIRMYEAKILRDTGDWAGAIFALRRAVAQTSAPKNDNPFLRTPADLIDKDPGQLEPDLVQLHTRAESMLRDMEVAIMRSALEKSQGALAQARKNFYTYLQERGFGEKSPGGVPLPKWWTAATGQDTMSREDAWAIFTTGITGALSGIMGRPGAEAEKLGLYETKMTTAFIGVHLMIRLRERGLTLKQIANLTPFELQKVVPLRRPDGREYTQMDIGQSRMAVLEALKLPEMAALLSENSDALRTAMSAGYWSESDVTDTWIEFMGDFTSPKNLLLTLLPMSVGTVGGSTQGVRLWSASRAEAVAAMRAIGAAESGTIVMSRVMGLQRALAAWRAMPSGKFMADMIMRAHSRYEQLGIIDRVIWHGGKATAMLGLMGAAEFGLDKLAGKEAAFVAQMMIQFAGEEELLLKFAYGNGHNPHLMAKLLDQHFIGVLKKQVAHLKSVKEEIGVWEVVMAEMKKGTDFLKLEQATRLKMAKRYSLPPAVEQMPAPDPAHNANIALQASAEAVANNTDDGSLAAAKALLQDVERDTHAQEVLIAKAEGVAAALKNAAPEPPPLPNRGRAVLEFALDDDIADLRIPPKPAPASKWAQIEQAIHDGRFEEADEMIDELFAAHRRAAEAGKPLTKNELPGQLWALKRKVVKARVTQLRPPAAPSAAIARSIEDAELDAALAMGRLTPEEYFNSKGASAGSSGTVGFAVDANRKAQYVVKEVHFGARLTPEHDLLQAMAEAEALSPDLLRMVGFEMPSARVKLFYNAEGKPVRAVFVSRFVEGKLLNDLTPQELFALRNQLSGSCAASVWVGNYDRKGDNYIFTGDRLVQIDGGQGDPCGTRVAMGSLPADDGYYMNGFYGRDHQWRNGYAYMHSNPNPASWNEGTMKWFMMEQSFTYQEALPTVNAIKQVLATRRGEVEATVRKRLMQLFADSPMAQNPEEFEKFIARRITSTMDTLQDRADALDDSMRALNARNQVAMPEGVPMASVASKVDEIGEREAAAALAAARGRGPVRVGGGAGARGGRNSNMPTGGPDDAPGIKTDDGPGVPNPGGRGPGAPRDNRNAPPNKNQKTPPPTGGPPQDDIPTAPPPSNLPPRPGRGGAGGPANQPPNNPPSRGPIDQGAVTPPPSVPVNPPGRGTPSRGPSIAPDAETPPPSVP
ncbi:MAG: hypothetical protein ABIZ49_08050, partial [Opitutaceae bacterium]